MSGDSGHFFFLFIFSLFFSACVANSSTKWNSLRIQNRAAHKSRCWHPTLICQQSSQSMYIREEPFQTAPLSPTPTKKGISTPTLPFHQWALPRQTWRAWPCEAAACSSAGRSGPGGIETCDFVYNFQTVENRAWFIHYPNIFVNTLISCLCLNCWWLLSRSS